MDYITTEVEAPEVQTADDLAEEAAFEAGFNATDIEPVAVEETVTTNQAEGTPAEPEQTPESAETKPAPQYLSVEEFNAALAAQRAEAKSLHDRVFGKMGDLQQRIDAIKTQASGISPKARQRMAAEFPELADMLFEGVDTAPEPEPPKAEQHAQPVIEPQVMPQYVQKIDEISRTFERKLLSRDHKDWEQVVKTPEFAAWKNALPANVSHELDTTWDADFVSSKITQFKEWKAKQATKQNKLEAAVVPQGIPKVGGHSGEEDDEEAWMIKSFKAR